MSNLNVNNPPGGPYSPSTIIGWLVLAVQTLWRRVNGVSTSGGGSGSLTIGDPVTGGGSSRVLYEDTSQNLAASTELLFNPVANSLTISKTTLISSTDAFSVTYPEATGIVAISANTNIFTALQTVKLDNLGATTATGLTIQNTTLASVTGHSNVYQSSPALTFLGSVQNALGAVNGFRLYFDGTGGVGNLRIGYATDGSTFTNVLTIGFDGGVASAASVTGNAVGATTSISAGTALSAGTTVTGGTGVIATTGNITATAGNVVITAAARTLDVNSSSAGSPVAGTATLVAGTVTVSTTVVATGDVIMLSLNTPGGTQGTHYAAPVASRTNGGGFVINAVDTSGALVNTDTSTIDWFIIHTH